MTANTFLEPSYWNRQAERRMLKVKMRWSVPNPGIPRDIIPPPASSSSPPRGQARRLDIKRFQQLRSSDTKASSACVHGWVQPTYYTCCSEITSDKFSKLKVSLNLRV